MAYNTPKLDRLGLLEMATETTFLSVIGAYAPLRVLGRVDLSGLKRDSLEDDHVRTGITQVARIPGRQYGSITTRHHLHGFSSTLPVAAPTVASHPLAEILGWAWGIVRDGGYVSTDPTGSTTAVFKGTDLSSFPIGGALAYLPPALNQFQVAWIANNDATPVPDEITVLQTATEAPSTNPTVFYGGVVAKMTSGRDRFSAGVRESLRLRFTSHDGEERYTLKGCMPTGAKLTAKRGELPILEITWGVAHWTREASVSAPTPMTWTYPNAEAVTSTWVAWGASAAAASRRLVGNFEFDLGLKVEEVIDTNFPGGIGGWVVTDRRPKATFTVFRDPASNYEIDDFDTQTARIFTFTHGTQPGKMWSLCLPAARVIEWPDPADQSGVRISKVTLEGHNYTGDTGNGSVANLIDGDCKFALL